jgi:hypothetical protein
MALLGKAAMILSFDIVPEAIVEHDHWHSREHLNDRMSIPGFLRGSRWTATSGGPRYFVMYEVRDLDTLASAPYLERLNNPTPWTSRMMMHYRGMNRGFCRLAFSVGFGLGSGGLLIRFSPDPERATALRDWLTGVALPSLPEKPGLVSAHLFEAALTPEMTREQRIRGKDGGVDWVLLVTGHDANAVGNLAAIGLSAAEIERHGAINLVSGTYQMVHSLSAQEAAIPDFTG